MELIDTTYFVQSLLLTGKNPNSCHRAGRIAKNFAQWAFDNGHFNTPLTGDDAAAWLNSLRGSGAAPATTRSYFHAIKSYMEWKGASLGALSEYKLPSLPKAVPHPLPGGVPDVRKMLNLATGQVQIMIALCGLAGLRIHEARTFTSSMIDRQRRELVIVGKGEKQRRIPISSELWKLIGYHYERDIVNLSDRGARLAVTRTAARAGVVGFNGEDVSSHDLRATFATAVYEKTGDVLLVSEFLGHASVTTTQVYLGLNAEFKKNSVEL